VWPTAEELGFPSEESCFGLQFGHGVGVGLYEPPMISRVHSFECPQEIEEGMVFALETYCAATDGHSAARIEEEVVVTKDGCRILTRFPAEELLVAGKTYVRGAVCSTRTSSMGPGARPPGRSARAQPSRAVGQLRRSFGRGRQCSGTDNRRARGRLWAAARDESGFCLLRRPVYISTAAGCASKPDACGAIPVRAPHALKRGPFGWSRCCRPGP
jgi:hypothetical protein